MTNQESPDEAIKAFVLQDASQELELGEFVLKSPRSDEVLVEVVACGVCHTDLHVMKNEVAFPKPAILGHEISGIVREVGDGVENLSRGDRIVCSFIMPCGTCRHCREGLSELCADFFLKNRLNGKLLDGTTRIRDQQGAEISMYSMAGHADLAVVPASAVHKLPDSLPLQEAAILGCSILTAYGAVHDVGELQAGQNVAVVAAGGIGLSIIHLAKAAGAQNIFAIDIDDDKLALAQDLGANHTINSNDEDPEEVIFKVLGRGVDVAFEALGSTPTVKQAVDLADAGGRVVLAGIAPAGHTLDVEITKVVRRKIQVLGSFGANPREAMPKVIEYAKAGKIDFAKLITDRFTFDQTNGAYTQLNAGNIRGRGIIQMKSHD